MSKKGSPLDGLSRRDLPKLDAVQPQTTAPEPAPTPQPPETRSSNITLQVEQWHWIEDRYQEARRGGWLTVSKSAILRALVAWASTVDVDLTGAESEEAIIQRINEARKL